MNMKQYGVNCLKRLYSNHEKNRDLKKSKGLNKAFNEAGIPLLVKSSKSPK